MVSAHENKQTVLNSMARQMQKLNLDLKYLRKPKILSPFCSLRKEQSGLSNFGLQIWVNMCMDIPSSFFCRHYKEEHYNDCFPRRQRSNLKENSIQKEIFFFKEVASLSWQNRKK